MLKLFGLILIVFLSIGCKSTFSEPPIYVLPDTEVSTQPPLEEPPENDDNTSPSPEVPLNPPTEQEEILPPIEGEIPYIPPSGYISSDAQTDVSITVLDENVHIGSSDVNKKLNMYSYAENEWESMDVNGARLNSAADNAIDMITINGIAYAAFSDTTVSSRLRLKKFNGSAWVDAGEKHLSVEAVSSISVAAINEDLYIAHKGLTGGTEGVIVKKFNTTTLALETLPSPYSGEVKNIHITPIDGVLHITFVSPADWSNFQRVFKYVENKWTGLGNLTATGGTVIEGALNVWNSSFGEIASYNTIPHVAYVENKSLRVVSFENDVWNNHSTVTTYSLEEVDFMVIENTLYVAYAISYDKKLRLQKYEGTKWVNVDSSSDSISVGAVAYVDMTYDNGILYVAYQDLSEEGGGRIKIESFEL